MIQGSQSWFIRPVRKPVGQPPALWYSVVAQTTATKTVAASWPTTCLTKFLRRRIRSSASVRGSLLISMLLPERYTAGRPFDRGPAPVGDQARPPHGESEIRI